jgi:arginyl-tRNA synthetase
VAGPGFLNLGFRPAFWQGVVSAILKAGAGYGRADLGFGEPVNVEYVSVNPTGPLHVGHGRGAAFGDALSNLLAFTGYAVTREYYVNDAGAQVDTLARSFRYRGPWAGIGEIPAVSIGDYRASGSWRMGMGPPQSRKSVGAWCATRRPQPLALIKDDLGAHDIRRDSSLLRALSHGCKDEVAETIENCRKTHLQRRLGSPGRRRRLGGPRHRASSSRRLSAMMSTGRS